MQLSVIIPTRNRSQWLGDAVNSILNQSLAPENYEIVVVDNGSTDGTRALAAQLEKKHPESVRCVHEERPGLHQGRHRGAREARGEILAFVDDDVIAASQWLEAIMKAFEPDDVALVGGKVLPCWEGEVPKWVPSFKKKNAFGWTLGYLSLLDFGNTPRKIPGKFVFGCNFSIRKSVLFECGGFHPDGMPEELIQFRGDGETALAKSVQAKGYGIRYEPEAVIYHRIPAERLTLEYFCRRAFNQGISESFTEIRQQHGLGQTPVESRSGGIELAAKLKKIARAFIPKKLPADNGFQPIRQQIANAHQAGKAYHQNKVTANPEILEYVLQKTYL